MVEPKIDDRAYNQDWFSRHDAFKSGVACLRFAPDYGHFRRHADVLKRLPCLQLNFFSILAVGMKTVFEAKCACNRKFYAATDRHEDVFRHLACLCCIFLLYFNNVDRRVDLQNSALPVLADTLISRIKHCQHLQTGGFLKFCIVVVDIFTDFQNSALPNFYKIEESMNSALLIFRRMKIPEKLHCKLPWFFTQYEMNPRIYITNRQCRFSETSTSV